MHLSITPAIFACDVNCFQDEEERREIEQLLEKLESERQDDSVEHEDDEDGLADTNTAKSEVGSRVRRVEK